MNALNYILSKWPQWLEKSPYRTKCSRKATFSKILRRIGATIGAEVGVERAVYSKILCSRVPNLKLYGIDCWESYPEYRTHVTQKNQDHFFLRAKERMKDYNFQQVKEYSVEAAKRFEDGVLDFVFIDSNHAYKYAKQDLKAWHPKVRKGGIVAGHDYMNGTYRGEDYGVKDAVNEWVKKKKIKNLFILDKDKCPSWFYVVK